MSGTITDTSESSQLSSKASLVDRFGRVHRSLRVSVTDVCNIRCTYCMPAEGAEFLPSSQLLSFEAIERFVRSVIPLGVSKLRLTGGEPLLRKNLPDLVVRLSQLEGIDDLALTTNAMLLAESVGALADAGLRRINISLDTLEEDIFQRISRRKGLQQVLDGIEAASRDDRLDVKLNALVLRDVNLSGVVELVEFAVARELPLRFIEFMPLDAERAWNESRMVSGDELRKLIASEIGELVPVTGGDPSRPSRDFRIANRPKGIIGFIDSVSKPFCGDCDRLRLTADGKLRNCLFGQEEWDVSELLNSGSNSPSEELEKQIRTCVQAKFAAHGIADPDFRQPLRPMYQIGG